MKKANKVLNIRNTITGLKYIAESPEQKLGGFHEYSILTARSALHHIKPRVVSMKEDTDRLLREIATCKIARDGVKRVAKGWVRYWDKQIKKLEKELRRYEKNT